VLDVPPLFRGRYKGLALPPNATFADAKTVVVSKFALTNISEYFDIVVLHPTKDGACGASGEPRVTDLGLTVGWGWTGSTAVRPVKPSEEVVQVLEGIKQQVRSWLQEATQVSRAPFVSLRDTELLKVVLKVCTAQRKADRLVCSPRCTAHCRNLRMVPFAGHAHLLRLVWLRVCSDAQATAGRQVHR